ncbi:MAG TPA: hypothetical protein VK700_02610 [Steroidobacteraceae bacterium]|nr:hypothetical protein [Steroidobacteraceae bacterium]
MSFRALITAFGLMLCIGGSTAVLAQAPASSAPPNPFAGLIRFNGTVTSAGAAGFVIHSDQGSDVKLTFADKPNIMVSAKGTVTDLGAGKFVGCTAVKRADHLLHATECHIFPESMRGMGEGHNPMGPPNTTMTNGNVSALTNGQVAANSGGASSVITVTYKGGQQSIHVGADTDITKIDAGTPAMVKPGVKVMGAAKPAADGSAQVVFLSLSG